VVRLCQDSVVDHASEKRRESRLAFRSPNETAILRKQGVKRASNLGVAMNAPPVIACQADKGAQLTDVGGGRNPGDGVNLGGVWLDPIR